MQASFLKHPPPLSLTDLTLNRKSFELWERQQGGKGALLPCEESGIRESKIKAGPGLG